MKVTTPLILSTTIREYRKKSKLTQAETAELIGIKQATVSDFEKKPGSTKLRTLFKILASLELELHVVKRGSTLGEVKGWDKEW
ncbi:helix-turn-helix domain-containing protein [Providencia alcalifaciens]|uniref:helix-turn-helix domain-containing protein n=1 Tax=Providencia alcalifaciens TaxID=126385 RepID=UPI001CC69483|nr:helix-turn-helix domain-containing protein [Providencia alcalifaciens]CAG9415763.1 Antitoxin HipB [Providencia alcalifaciens]